jgi:FAD/FMN-containing dehydrogenase
VLHAGDGNLHPSFLYDGRQPEQKKRAEAASLDFLRICAELGGTISGEHGIGVEKLEAMHFVFGDDDLRAQSYLKEAFDPRGLCNPGKVLPPRRGKARV